VDVPSFRSPWEPPFLSTITSKQQNRLKACVVAGKSENMCVFLFDPYGHRSLDLETVMECTVAVRAIMKVEYQTSIFRFGFTEAAGPCFGRIGRPASSPTSLPEQRTTTTHHHSEAADKHRPSRGLVPFHSDCVRRIPGTVLVEILTLLRMTAGMYGAGKMFNPEIIAAWQTLQFTIKGVGQKDCMPSAMP
jgi:hypothetical protein